MAEVLFLHGSNFIQIRDDNDTLDPPSFFDASGLLLIRAKNDFSYPSSDTIESSLEIIAAAETLLVVFDT